MHFRNSCTRSMSSCRMRQVPSGASGGPRLELRDRLLGVEVPGHVGHEVADRRERAHRLDGDREDSGRSDRRVMHISFGMPLISAEQRSALPGLAVPAQRQIVGLLGLDRVDRVENDHARDASGVV
mgnify:CR=1 FL=1